MLRLFRASPLILRRYGSANAVEYDLIVIGGGSGGLACSKAAADAGARVALVDAVEPSPHGASWGIGGTCANVGCIPKKLMHHATIVGKEANHAAAYGWKEVQGKGAHDWPTLAKVVGDRIKANNWIYRVQLNEKGVKYYNSFASFVDAKTVRTVAANKKGTEVILKAPSILIATGLRPRYPEIPGAKLGITSDEVFSLPKAPGRTLVVGASYVALETAGLLADLGHKTDLLVRSQALKGFDRDCVSLVERNLSSHGVNILRNNEVASVEAVRNKKKVSFTSNLSSEEYDTVIWAIGREPKHHLLNLEAAGVKTASNSARIVVDEADRTTIHGVYALGDVAEGRPELTPTAIRAGQLLARRLFSSSEELMDYQNVATTVFTPLELGTVGMTEEQATERFGADNLEIYHSFYTPFEFVIPQDPDSADCYAKVICLRNAPRTVLGLHLVGPNAAEVIQGFAVAMKLGMTFEQLKATIAIHPCSAEELVKVAVTKRSGLSPKTAGCCG